MCRSDAALMVRQVARHVAARTWGNRGADQTCSKSLPPGRDLQVGETEVTSTNRRSTRVVLFPLKVASTFHQIICLVDLLGDPSYKPWAEDDTTPGDRETKEALPFSGVGLDISVRKICDASAITAGDKTKIQHSLSEGSVWRTSPQQWGEERARPSPYGARYQEERSAWHVSHVTQFTCIPRTVPISTLTQKLKTKPGDKVSTSYKDREGVLNEPAGGPQTILQPDD